MHGEIHSNLLCAVCVFFGADCAGMAIIEKEGSVTAKASRVRREKRDRRKDRNECSSELTVVVVVPSVPGVEVIPINRSSNGEPGSSERVVIGHGGDGHVGIDFGFGFEASFVALGGRGLALVVGLDIVLVRSKIDQRAG